MNRHLLTTAALLTAFMLIATAVSAQKGTPPKPVITMISTTNYPQNKDFSPSMLSQLKVPAGWSVKVAASGLGKPRMLQLYNENMLYITRRDAGDVLMLTDTNGDHVFDEMTTVVADFKGVHGIALKDGWMYLMANRELKRFRHDAKTGMLSAPQVIFTDLPDGGQHPNRTMTFGPDGKLYISVGSTCNDCAEPNKENATMLQVDTSNWTRRIYARGLRNTIGFDFNANGEFYGVDNGGDTKGDDWPREELNLIKDSADYGWPWVYEKQVPDETREEPNNMPKAVYAKSTEPSVLEFTAHSAPIAFTFLKNGTALPEDWRDDGLVCWHGSWNRKEPSGFKVERIVFENGKAVRGEDFLSGFLNTGDRTKFGRPAGITVARDGAVYVSDDNNGVLYVVEPAK